LANSKISNRVQAHISSQSPQHKEKKLVTQSIIGPYHTFTSSVFLGKCNTTWGFLDPSKCQFAPADFVTQVEGLQTHMLLH